MALRKDLATLFEEYFKEKDKVQPESIGDVVPEIANVALADHEAEEVKDIVSENVTDHLNNEIINWLKSNSELPASITQDMLIRWCCHNFNDFDRDKPTDQQHEFMIIAFSNQHFMDRLILGKGSTDYNKNARNYHQKGKMFIENLLVKGIVNNLIPSEDLEKKKSTWLNKSVDPVRLAVNSYMTAKTNLTDKEADIIKDIYTSPEQLFEAYFSALSEIEKTQNDARISILKSKMEALNNKIIPLLLSDNISSKITQEMLIEWCTVNFYEFNKAKITKNDEALLSVFSNKTFLDRLILGKGSQDYPARSEEYANHGLKFVELLMKSGYPEEENPEADSVKNKRNKFPTISYHMSIPRMQIDAYLLSDEFTDAEKINVKVIYKKTIDLAKQKWNIFHNFLYSKTAKDDIQLNIKRLIYNDIRIKSLKKNINDQNDFEKLFSILPDTFDEFIHLNRLSGNSYQSLMEQIENKANNYLLLETEIDIDLTQAPPLTLSKETENTLSNLPMNEEYIRAVSTVNYILRSDATLPDFITREDLIQMLLIDPGRMILCKFHENESFLQRLGNLDEVILLLERQVKKFAVIGLNTDMGGAQLQIREIQNQKAEAFDKYKETLEEAGTLLKDIEEKVKAAETINHHDSQLTDFSAIKDVNLLDLTESKRTEFSDYIKKVIKDNIKYKSIDFPNLMTEIDESLDQLEKHFKSLKKTEAYIKEQQEKNILPDPNLQTALIDIHHKLIEIERAKDKVNFLKNNYKLHVHKNKSKKINKIKQMLSKKYIISNADASKNEMILYLIIMTRKSILEGNPTREYIQELYKDKKLNAFLLKPSSTKLKKKLNKIEKELIKEVARQFKNNGRMALANTDKEYFTINPSTNKPYKEMTPEDLPNYEAYRIKCIHQITSEINACTDLRSRKKVNSYWVKVMEQAYRNQDQFTLNIISSALRSQNTKPFIGKSIFFKSSRLKLHKILSLSKDGKDFLSSTQESIKENNYDFVPDPSVFTAQTNSKHPSAKKKEFFNTFSNYYAHLQNNFVVALPQAKADKYQSIFNWLNGTAKPGEVVSITVSELGSYIAYRLSESTGAVDHDFKAILEKLPKCKTHRDLVSCLDHLPLKDQVQIKNIDSLYHTISKHIELQKKEMLAIVTNTPKKNMQHFSIKQEQLPELIAIKMIDYLKLVKQGLEINNRNTKTAGNQEKQIIKINNLIDLSIAALQKTPPPTLNQISVNLTKLHADLQKATKRSSFLPQKLFVFKRKSSNDNHNPDALSLIRNDINYINTINKLISHTERDLQEKMSPTVTPAPVEIKSTVPIDEDVTVAARTEPLTHSHSTSDILSTFDVDPVAHSYPDDEVLSPIHSPDSKSDFDDNLFFKFEGWTFIESIPLMTPSHSAIAAPLSDDIQQFMPKEYVHSHTKTHICESFKDNQMQVNVTQEPENYAGMPDELKEQTDLMIAFSMVQLLVNRCGPQGPFEILDTNTEGRMRALILICKANDLNVTLPTVHPFSGKADELGTAVSKMKTEKTYRIQIPAVSPIKDASVDPAPTHTPGRTFR